MLYDEFIKGTGCRDNEHNYEVYKSLEFGYMNFDWTKEQVYEMGKKIVDNSPSKEERELIEQINADIDRDKERITFLKEQIEVYASMAQDDKFWLDQVKSCKEEVLRLKRHINALKFIMR